ncbi:Formin-like protein 3 [Cichlidogyrus casuarinus]|uniref:Formin-like protein 3 n=1 Tax=Cichlidogyrus casuarinus TaxID=1844966 RepID=A0ABD2PQS6_9PLAT
MKIMTRCMLHPNFSTKIIVIQFLTCICLIEGGHGLIIAAFDSLREELAEKERFKTLVHFLQTHEHLAPEDYSIDFVRYGVQLVNVLVHNAPYMELRLFLQQQFEQLGFDDHLLKLQKKASGDLLHEIEAYNRNRVDIQLLLEESQAHMQAQTELEKAEQELHTTQSRMAMMQSENAANMVELQSELQLMKVPISLFSNDRFG